MWKKINKNKKKSKFSKTIISKLIFEILNKNKMTHKKIENKKILSVSKNSFPIFRHIFDCSAYIILHSETETVFDSI